MSSNSDIPGVDDLGFTSSDVLEVASLLGPVDADVTPRQIANRYVAFSVLPGIAQLEQMLAENAAKRYGRVEGPGE